MVVKPSGLGPSIIKNCCMQNLVILSLVRAYLSLFLKKILRGRRSLSLEALVDRQRGSPLVSLSSIQYPGAATCFRCPLGPQTMALQGQNECEKFYSFGEFIRGEIIYLVILKIDKRSILEKVTQQTICQHGGKKYSGFKSFQVLIFHTEELKAILFCLDLRIRGASVVGQKGFFSLIRLEHQACMMRAQGGG